MESVRREENGTKTFDGKEVSTELCGFVSLHGNADYETVFPPPPNYRLNNNNNNNLKPFMYGNMYKDKDKD